MADEIISRVARTVACLPRLRILSALAREGETAPPRLAHDLCMRLDSVSVHLKHLSTAGLIQRRRSGAWCYGVAASPYPPSVFSGRVAAWLYNLLRQPELAVSHRRLDQVRCVDDRTAHVPLRLESPWREVDSTWLSEDGSWSPAFRPPPSNGGKDADRRPVLRTCRRRVGANGIADLINSATDLSSPHMDVMARPESRPVTDKATRSEVSARACPLLHAKAGLPAKAPKLPPACIRTGWPTHSRPPVARAISYYTVARRIVSGYGRPA
jgi:hypothetical protein